MKNIRSIESVDETKLGLFVGAKRELLLIEFSSSDLITFKDMLSNLIRQAIVKFEQNPAPTYDDIEYKCDHV